VNTKIYEIFGIHGIRGGANVWSANFMVSRENVWVEFKSYNVLLLIVFGAYKMFQFPTT